MRPEISDNPTPGQRAAIDCLRQAGEAAFRPDPARVARAAVAAAFHAPRRWRTDLLVGVAAAALLTLALFLPNTGTPMWFVEQQIQTQQAAAREQQRLACERFQLAELEARLEVLQLAVRLRELERSVAVRPDDSATPAETQPAP
jgi:hypothetical protein